MPSHVTGDALLASSLPPAQRDSWERESVARDALQPEYAADLSRYVGRIRPSDTHGTVRCFDCSRELSRGATPAHVPVQRCGDVGQQCRKPGDVVGAVGHLAAIGRRYAAGERR